MHDELRILHVDDEVAFAELVVEFLEREDDRFDVTTAHSATKGLEVLDEVEVDCVISDYDMPGMDGLEFFTSVREHHSELPFILFTGKGSEEVASEAISAGISDYLQKGSSSERYTLLANRVKNAIEQVRARRRATDLQRINSMVRDINAALAHATTVEEIDTRVCEIISESRQYRFAWIGTVDDVSQEVTPRESAGVEEEYLSEIEISADDRPTGQGPTGMAVRTHELQVMQNISEQSAFEPWREAALERGYRSSAAVPLVHDEQLYGILNVYAPRANAFDTDEQELLSNLGASIAHAYHRVNLQHESIEQYRTLFEEAPFMVVFTRDESNEPIIEDCNREFAERLGYECDELIGSPLAECYNERSVEVLLDGNAYKRVLAGEFLREQRTLVTRDGEEVLTILRAGPRKDHTGEIIGTHAMFLDITEEQQLTELEQTNAVLSNLFEALPQGILVADDDRDITTLNPQFFELFGHDASVSRYIGKRSEELLEVLAQQVTDPTAFLEEVTQIEQSDQTRDYAQFELTGGETLERRYRSIELPPGRGHLWVYNDVSDLMDFTETIEELHHRSHELVLLEETEVICQKAVEIAKETLDFPLSGIHLVDEHEERLVPVAVTDAVIEHLGEAPVYERHDPTRTVDDYNWEVFTSGEPIVMTDITDHEQVSASDTPTKSGITYPLGDHGIFITSSAEPRAFTDRDVTLVELFSTILTAVLDRTKRSVVLEHTETFLRESLDVFADAFVVIDEDLEILRWNVRFEEVIGYDSDEINDMTTEKFVYEDHRTRMTAAVDRVLETESGRVQLDVLTKTGERIPYEFRGTRVPHPDGSGFVIACAGRAISNLLETEL